MNTHRATGAHRRTARLRNSKVARGVLSLLTAASVGLGITVAAQPATAAPNGNVVVIGDSYAANPDQYYNTFRNVDGFVPDNYPRQSGCLQAPNSWPRQLSKRHGVPVNDWSCSGLTSKRAISRVDAAHRAGDIHAGTRTVVLNYGMNNHGWRQRCGHPTRCRSRFLADTRAAVNEVRRR